MTFSGTGEMQGLYDVGTEKYTLPSWLYGYGAVPNYHPKHIIIEEGITRIVADRWYLFGHDIPSSESERCTITIPESLKNTNLFDYAINPNDYLTFQVKQQSVFYFQLMNAMDYHVPQERYRVFVVGIRRDIDVNYQFPQPDNSCFIALRQAIGDITEEPRKYTSERVDTRYDKWLNHDVYMGPFDERFMARNRVRGWNEVSYTMQAKARNCPLHPQAPKMVYVSRDKQIFRPGYEHLYRRFSVRECARIQTFPDGFRFIYHDVCDGYKMVGNAVPPRLGRAIALSVKEAFSHYNYETCSVLVATYRDEKQLRMTLENKLYYVRAGIRTGAMQFSLGMKAPRYLFLHKKDSFILFLLKEVEPLLVSASYLQNLGFNPSGEQYWTFELLDVETAERTEYVRKIVANHGGMKMKPYIIRYRK